MMANVSTVPGAMTGRIARCVSAASSSGIESSVSAERPLKLLPFITATFMKRTVS